MVKLLKNYIEKGTSSDNAVNIIVIKFILTTLQLCRKSVCVSAFNVW